MSNPPQHLPRPQSSAPKRHFTNIPALIGLIIIGVIVIWGLVHIAQLSSPWFASLFPKATPKITVTSPVNVTAGTPFDISWKYTTTEKGYYAFLASCQNGVQFKTDAASGNLAGQAGMINIPCGAAFSIPAGNTKMSLTATLANNISTKVPLSIIFISSTSSGRVQGSATVTVNPGTVTKTPEPVTKPTTKPSPKPRPIVTGPADLSVRITSANMDAYGNGVITFDISNIGGSSTGTWYFTAQLPTQSGYIYNSPAQISLAPGDHIANTLNFTQGVVGIASIQVDPYNAIPEAAKGNNYASQQIGFPYYTPQYTY